MEFIVFAKDAAVTSSGGSAESEEMRFYKLQADRYEN
jgi:hypothetical protein